MKKLLNTMHKNQEGFTLVELMIVVVIIGILVAIAIPIYGTITESAERTAVEANLRTVDGAIMMYRAEYEEYPIGEGDGEEGNVTLLEDYVEEFEAAGAEDYRIMWLDDENNDDRSGQDFGADDKPYGYFKGEVGGITTSGDGSDWVRLPISDWDALE